MPLTSTKNDMPSCALQVPKHIFIDFQYTSIVKRKNYQSLFSE